MAGEGSVSVNAALSGKMVKGAWTLKRLLYLLDSLAKYDMQVEKKREKSGWTAALFFTASVAGGITWIIYEIDAIGYAAIFSALLFVLFLVSYNGYLKKELPDDFRDYLIPLLKLLSGDIKEKSKIALKMDIAQLQKQEYSKGAQALPLHGPYYDITSERFERKLMTLAIHLRDGNRLLMERFESLTVVNKSKKNPRGKHKTKTKYKRAVSTRVKLAVNPRVYSVRKTASDAGGERVSVKPGRKRMALDLKFTEKGGLDAAMKAGSAIRQIAVLYSRLAPAKR